MREELQALIDAKANMVVLDARRYDEYRTMSIPSAVSVPGAAMTKYETGAGVPGGCAGRIGGAQRARRCSRARPIPSSTCTPARPSWSASRTPRLAWTS